MEEHAVPIALGIVALVCVVIFVACLAIFLFRRPLVLALVAAGLGVCGYTFGGARYYMIAAGVAVVAVLGVLSNRRRRSALAQSAQFGVVIEPVEAPKRKRRRKKPPEITPERMFEKCTELLRGDVADPELLRSEIARTMNSRNFTDWALADNDMYFEAASAKQLGYLQALGYVGDMPEYMGEASFLIECVLTAKAYCEKLDAQAV